MRKPGLRERAFSLIELILACLIMAVVGGFGLFSLVTGHDSAQSKGLAEAIAEELKAARQQAVSEQMPVALAFPSSGGSLGGSQAFYQLEGHARPRLTRSMSYSETYPESCFFWGAWGGATRESVAPSPVATEFNVSAWTPLPNATDYLLVFTPTGTVKSNGLPLFNGEYRLLVSNGVEGGNGLGTPTAVSKPYTVSISKAGGVTVQPGVSGGVGIPYRPSLSMGVLANSIPSGASPSGGPTILPLRSEPKPEERSEGGALTVVPEEGYLTLIAEARDPSGEPLSMRWEAERGRFSSQEPINMTWDQKEQLWTGRVAWTPPANAEVGEIFDLTCFVANPRGQEDEAQLDASKAVEVVPSEKIANVSTDGSWETFYLAWMNPEGANVVNVTVPKPGTVEQYDMLTPVWAPNGAQLAFYAWERLQGDAIKAIFYIVNDDGTNLKKVFETAGDLSDYNFGPSFSPNGARVTFSAYEDPDAYLASRVYVRDVFGTREKVQCTGGPGNPDTFTDHIDVSWHPTADWILYTGTVYYDSGNNDVKGSSLRVCDVRDLDNPVSRYVAHIYDDGTNDVTEDDVVGESHWSHNGDKICYIKGRGLYVLRFDPVAGYALTEGGARIDYGVNLATPAVPTPSPPEGLYLGRKVSPPGVTARIPRFSPDGNKIAYVDGSDRLRVVNADGSNPRLLTNLEVYGYNWSPYGDELAFSTWDEKMYIVSATTPGAKDVTPPGFQAWTAPSWWAPPPE